MATTSAPGTEFSDDLNAGFVDDGGEVAAGTGPWQLAWRRLRRNKVALFFGGVFLLIVILCLLAPVYSHDVAHIGPATATSPAPSRSGGKAKDIVSPDGHPDRADVARQILLRRRRQRP